ncbi:hypothetical protein B9G55_11110 [Saccharibacillus sp. O16]|nr:hypothetical protein B9G55_11110 [Saccharibacillus sp. O16]
MGNEMALRFQRLIALCTEDYLIRYANKGLYNRALKDMEKGITVNYAWGRDNVTCTLSDGTVCTLTDSIERFDCSCPSDKICKHVLIGLLYAAHHGVGEEEAAASTAAVDEDRGQTADQAADTSEETEESPAVSSVQPTCAPIGKESETKASPKLDFSWLLEREIAELIAPFQAAKVEEAAFRLRYQEELTVSEGSLLVVRMNRSGVEVAFTESPDVSRALCAVPGADGEMYKLEALLRYRASRGRQDQDALARQLTPVAAPPELLQQFRESVDVLLRGGLARLPRSFAARFELLAIAARSGGLPNLEREARGIHGELELFFARHVRFSVKALLGRLSRAALMVEALERDIAPARKAQLAGRFRSRYYTVPRLDLYGLGAEPWETRSGYRGITYYFYCAEDGGIYTYAQARPAYYEGAAFDYMQHYQERTPWKPDLTLRTASASMLSMRSIKVNDEGRLSAGGSPSVSLLDRPAVGDFDFGSLRVDSCAKLSAEGGGIRLFGGKQRQLKLIRASAVQGCVYDYRQQALQLQVVDAAGDPLELLLPYQANWGTALNRLESGRGLPGEGEFYIFAAVEPSGIYPISFLQGTAQLSLKLDLQS